MITQYILGALITIGMTLGMMALYRMHGGAPPKLPWKFDEICIASLIAVPSFLALLTKVGTLYDPYPAFVWYGTLAAFLGAMVLKLKGHGQFMTLNFARKFIKAISAEGLDIFVRPFFGKDPRVGLPKNTTKTVLLEKVATYGERKLWWRCLFGLFVSGSSVAIGIVGVLIYLDYWLLAVTGFLVFGVSKASGYAFGWKTVPEGRPANAKASDLFDESTERGEVIAGIGPGLFVGIITAYFLLFT